MPLSWLILVANRKPCQERAGRGVAPQKLHRWHYRRGWVQAGLLVLDPPFKDKEGTSNP